jgi:hypothetical protein
MPAETMLTFCIPLGLLMEQQEIGASADGVAAVSEILI